MLSVKNLTKIYKIKGGNDTVALDNVSVDFPETGMVFLLGKSGSGKSTLLNLIGGLDFPTSGEIILKGRSSKDFSQSDFDSYRNTYIGFVFQEYNILNEFNVEQNIALAMELQGKKSTKEEVNKLLEQVDIAGYGKRKPNTLSGGQKQRIAIARALIKEPNIIMADEPTGALDSKTGEQVFDTLKKLSKDKLIIVVSHDKDFAKRYGDRIIELKDGKIISDRTKHYLEATTISDNVSIINDNAIRINDANKLTKKEFDELYKVIKNSEGKVFISSGENADKSMKAARISDDGRSETFKQTESIILKDYDASKTTFIRSKMPMNKSIKMGLSGLKSKPIRLFFTILLSVVSFTMFGVSAALMFYDTNHTYSEALKHTDYQAEVLEKQSLGKQYYPVYNSKDQIMRVESSPSSQEVYFGEKELEQLNKNNLGLVYIPVAPLTDGHKSLDFSDVTITHDEDYYKRLGIRYISNATEEQFNKLGYDLVGHFPQNENDILLPKSYGDMLIGSRARNKSNYTELVNTTISISSIYGSQTELNISGFFDAGNIPSKYDAFKDNSEPMSYKERDELDRSLDAYLSNSFNGVAFVGESFYEQYAAKISSQIRDTFYRDLRIETTYYDEHYDDSDTIRPFFTELTVKENPKIIEVYNLNDEMIDRDSFTINEDEVYLPVREFRSVAKALEQSLFNSVFELYYKVRNGVYGSDDRIVSYLPNFADYLHKKAFEFQNEMHNYSSAVPSKMKDIIKQHSDELDRAYILNEFIDEYKNTDNYSSLPKADADLIDKCAKQNGQYFMSEEELNNAYGILVDNFDKEDACRYYFPYKYIVSLSHLYHTEMANEGISDIAYYSSYKNMSDEDAQKAISFIDRYGPKYVSEYKDWRRCNNGYTLKDYHFFNDSVYEADEAVCYFYSKNAGNGELKVKGYYIAESSACPLVSSEFLDKAGVIENRAIEAYYETNYVAPKDAKYIRLMVKSNFSKEQIDCMLRTNSNDYRYSLTSDCYMSVSFVAEMAKGFRQVFLWIGVGFGVFSALMLLNFITVSISSKKKDIGILRAIGARKSDVFKIFFAESLFIATLCSVLAIISAQVVDFFLDRYFVSEAGVSIIQFNILTVVFIVAIALVIAFVATIIPVIHSSKKPPVESIRSL